MTNHDECDPLAVILTNDNWPDPTPGITVRAHFAAMAMQGLLAGESTTGADRPFELVAQLAVEAADALIAELNKKPEAKS